ncbi:glycoside hydrolase family 6 protein [Actinoplanes sp. NBRC 101535]|uniref:glycoside hydrolase family 6 protein n=1 Tax=Actinoplanes sp. NBRC 101535 TaxID=3032196 RepID=UPI00255305B6|nr:glycoside hydrolase family 6 protein [Actinoplanes sp. NBRC 101535]
MRRLSRALLSVTTVATLGVAGCSDDPSTPTTADSPPAAGSPSAAVENAGEFYVEPTGPAVDQVAQWEAAGRTADATAIRRIAAAPMAVWFADGNPGYADRARALVTAASTASTTPLLVAYHVPQRDCGGYSGGGASDAAAYRTWIAALADAVRGSGAIVVLEPDAITHVLEGCVTGTAVTERYALLAEAIRELKKDGSVRVYLDAGNPSWIKDVDRVVDGLQQAGVGDADGFSLNVANFETTEANIAYGDEISNRLGGKNYVIDTSRNGNGPAEVGSGDGHWCNPPGRALGATPTTATGHDRVDAYLWIKRPGESDGACGDGAPEAGQWWPDYALGLATN